VVFKSITHRNNFTLPGRENGALRREGENVVVVGEGGGGGGAAAAAAVVVVVVAAD
jgi:hypothetical protein